MVIPEKFAGVTVVEVESLEVVKVRHDEELLIFCVWYLIYCHQTPGREMEVWGHLKVR